MIKWDVGIWSYTSILHSSNSSPCQDSTQQISVIVLNQIPILTLDSRWLSLVVIDCDKAANPGILQKKLQILFNFLFFPFNPMKWSEVKSLSRVRLFVTPWTVAYQDPQSMGFSRQEYWSGLPFPSPGDLPDTGIETHRPSQKNLNIKTYAEVISVCTCAFIILKIIFCLLKIPSNYYKP